MEDLIYVSIPSQSAVEEVNLVDYFNELSDVDAGHDFLRALDLMPNLDDSRIELVGVEIQDVHERDDSIYIVYDVDFTAYYGCRDVDGGHTVDGREIEGRREDGYWVFERYQQPPARLAPNEEF